MTKPTRPTKPKSNLLPVLQPDRFAAFDFIRGLRQSGDVAEVLLFKTNKSGKIYRVYFGFFDNFLRLAEAAVILNHCEKRSVFVTLNPLRPRAGVDNRVYVSNAHLQRTLKADGQPLAPRMRESKFIKKTKTGTKTIVFWRALHTVEEDITRRKWILIDVDAGQPSGTSSTAEEKKDAENLALTVIDDLNTKGICTSFVDSGNGYHVYIPVDLPNDDASKSLVKEILHSLSLKFTKQFGLAEIDTTVYDAKRITKVAGTVVYKGEATEDRPHRVSGICIWDARETATPEQLQSLVSAEGKAAVATPSASREGEQLEQPRIDLTDLITASSHAVAKKLNDVEEFLKYHGIPIYSTVEDTKKITLTVRCPNAKKHTTVGRTAVIFINKHAKKTAHNDGVSLGFSCQHDHCKALKGWKNFRKFCDMRKPGGRLGGSPRWEKQERRQALKQETADQMNAAGWQDHATVIILGETMIFDYSKKAMMEFLLSKEPTVAEAKKRADELGLSRRAFAALRQELGVTVRSVDRVRYYVRIKTRVKAKPEVGKPAQQAVGSGAG